MADLSDVLETLATNVSELVYPNGTSNPSIAGVNVVIAPGWPIRNILDTTLLAGNAMISIFPEESETIGPIFERIEQGNTLAPKTIFADVLNDTITITGTISVPQIILTIVNGQPFAYQLDISDTLHSIAASIAALLPSAVAVGNVITVSSFYKLETRISTVYSSSLDLGRQKRSIMISCWCPNASIRKILGSALVVYFKQIYRFVLPDNFWANNFYKHTREIDFLEKQDVYRRDVIINVLYATTSTVDNLQYIFPISNVSYLQ